MGTVRYQVQLRMKIKVGASETVAIDNWQRDKENVQIRHMGHFGFPEPFPPGIVDDMQKFYAEYFIPHTRQYPRLHIDPSNVYVVEPAWQSVTEDNIAQLTEIKANMIQVTISTVTSEW